MIMEFNYASVEIETTNDNDIKIELAIKNYYNEDVAKKIVLVNKEL